MKSATRTLTIRMIAASLAAAGAIFGGLAVQMAHGHDPALGAGTSTAATAGSSTNSTDQGSGASGDQFSQQDQSGGSPAGVVTRAS